VDVATTDHTLVVTIADDGIGGADPGRGSGLRGLVDRVEAVGGTSRSRARPARARDSAVTCP
jgi:signal transduction histidine kinase